MQSDKGSHPARNPVGHALICIRSPRKYEYCSFGEFQEEVEPPKKVWHMAPLKLGTERLAVARLTSDVPGHEIRRRSRFRRASVCVARPAAGTAANETETAAVAGAVELASGWTLKPPFGMARSSGSES